MRAQTTIFTVVASLIAVALGVSVFIPAAAILGDSEEQKKLYVANDLALLVETVAMLPEDSNFLLPDIIPNTTAKLIQQQLEVSKDNSDWRPSLRIPKTVTLKDKTVNIDYMYVSKSGSVVTFSEFRQDSCLKTYKGGVSKPKISISPLNDEPSLEKFSQAINNVLKSSYSVNSADGLKIKIAFGLEESISVSSSANRKQTSMSCFLEQSTGLKRTFSSDEDTSVIINIKHDSDGAKLRSKIIEGINKYYE